MKLFIVVCVHSIRLSHGSLGFFFLLFLFLLWFILSNSSFSWFILYFYSRFFIFLSCMRYTPVPKIIYVFVCPASVPFNLCSFFSGFVCVLLIFFMIFLVFAFVRGAFVEHFLKTHSYQVLCELQKRDIQSHSLHAHCEEIF